MEQLVARAKALADPTRLKLLRILVERECSVHELVDVLATGQSRVSQHLARLKAAGLVRERRSGREVFYSARADVLFGLDQDLSAFFHTPIERLPDMRGEWRRWCAAGPSQPAPTGQTGGAGARGGDALPLVFKPEPAVAAGRPTGGAGQRRPRLLFLCTANSFRSQIAEAWARVLGGRRVEVQSAGLEPARIHPLAEAVMREVGIDLEGQYAKAVTPEMLDQADVVVTLCGPALAWFPATRREVRREHWPLPDPTALGGPEDTVLREGRRVRDQIRRRVEALLDSLGRAS